MKVFQRIKEEFFPAPDEFDRTHGTDTVGLVSLFRLHINSVNKKTGYRYQTFDPNSFVKAMQPIDRDRTFIDLGCGKGRALILGNELGFCRIIGVEFSAKLAEIAERQCPAAEVVVADAAGYVFPDERVCVFLYNPFGPSVLSRVVRHLPEDFVLVYANPLHGSEIPFPLVSEFPGWKTCSRQLNPRKLPSRRASTGSF